ncbi:hypothetical protein [Marinigracilibium pacificum]|uniref:Uncharacterized protein n=1 Tax=Marinigracilibium pacificum TaxID=2729599 RepID=A0A848IZ44_9BACT|nr:hypothetical protein [Marinigracilibium pacificum]NMM48906.1 hypothetical protein [Marinigracilibium pacificum]
MIKKLTKYPIAYLMALIVIYSVYDYFEHIGRNGSIFEEHPWYWLQFNIAAILLLILVIVLVKKLIQRIFNKKSLIIEVAAIGIWIILYISILGPLIDKLFWPFDDLYFNFNFGPFIIILIAYFIIRVLINLVVGKNALYSK